MSSPMPSKKAVRILRKGTVIPAHPLALDARRRLDERRQVALTRYYIAAGAGGIAVGVHTTQFEIHDSKVGLYRPVLELASETAGKSASETIVKIAGICGNTRDAVREAREARDYGYDMGLLSLGAFRNAPEAKLLDHSRAVADIIPLFGFYLQPLAGGRTLSFRFWQQFFRIENAVAVKIAPFNRYSTLDVIRALITSGREKEIALYTGNDDSIVADLVTPYEFYGKRVRMAGGLLGHWAFWTRRAVELLEKIKELRRGKEIPCSLLKKSFQITDSNSAIFDAANNFRGCIPGINEMLRRSGLLKGIWCINPAETLSPGQKEEIDRVYLAYPHLRDDSFVRENIDTWLR